MTVDIHTLIGLPDPHLRQRLAALLEQGIHYLHVQDGERPDLPAVLAPDWFSLLEQVFDAHAASELLEEGPVLYIHTWFLDAMTTNRCPVSRPARLLQDRRTWRSALIAVWQDQIHTHQPIDFAFVDPAPPRLPWMSPTAHLLLTQRADPVHASVLVSAINHQADDPVMIQAMHYLPQRVSGADVIDAHMAQTLSGPCRVRRGPHVFPAIQAVQIGNGDSLEIDLPPSATVQASADTDALNLLQRQAAITRRKVHPVLLSLDAVIPPNQDADLTKIRPPEVLFSEEDDWHNRLCDMELHFAPLPENLDLRATTLHALQDPASYIESSFAGRLALYVDGSARGHAAAWSVIAVEYDGQGLPTLLGALSGQVELNHSSTQWIGATNADNVAAELTASIAAHLAAIALGHPAFTVIRPDLKLSAMLSTSTWSCHSHSDLAAIARWLGAWFAQGGGTCNEVRGHSAHPWNDLADSVARHALSVVTPVGAVDFDFCHQLLISGDIAWAWIGLQPPCYAQCLPPNGVSTSWLAQPSLRKVGAPPSSSVPSEGQWHQVQFTIASANVLAISSDLPAFPAESASSRAERLDQQWHQQQIAVIGLQESRRAAGRYATTHYHVFASGATQDGGAPHGGCELWLHKHLPFLSAPEHSLSFAQLRPAISCADSRRLVLHLHSPQFSCSFVVLHAPCRSQHTSLEEVATWWRQTTDLLDKAELAPMTWLFVDANAPLATGACENFGDHGSESTNEQGHLFEQFILTGRWFAPTTMSWCHIGPHATWTHPRGQRLRRDYVLCSAQAFQWCNSSWTDQAYDGGFAHEDHVPVCLQHSGWWYVEQSAAQHQWDRCAFLDPVTCDAFQQALATLPVPSWTVNINDHADHFQHGVMQLARQFFTKKSGERVRPRLSEPTLALIQLKRSFLDYARAQSCIQDEDVKTELRSLERIIRARVQADHRLFYDQLVHQLAQDGALHDFRSVYQLLSRLGGRPRHKSGKGRPLPLLKTEDGRVVTSFQDQQRLWLRQFAAVEGGVPVARQTLPTLMPAALGLPAERLDLTAIPTCEQLASKIRKMKRGKAPGPDGLPAEIFKAGALPMLHHVVAMTTKTAIHAREPNSWRGGRLIPLHKGKTARSDPTGYRSIFVSNFVTKLYHSVLRDHLVDVWHHALSHLQFGGRKGCSSDTPHLLVQQHFEYAHARKLPSAALFVDFKSAFYTVIRQGLFSDSLDETTFMVAMHRLGVAPQDLVELLSTAAQDEATKGLSSHVQALLTDLFRGTYFELDGLSEVALTSRGTRPGDPVGDILFNLVMAIVLKDITFSLQEASSAMWLGSPTPVDALHHHAEPPVFAFYEVAFVDDLAVLMRAADIEQLLDFAAQALQAVHNAAGRRGLSLNMQAGKTELICALVGPGARKAKIQLASQQNLHPVTLGGKLHHLRLVHAYKHLGGWVHADAQPRHTVRERLTSARQAWGPLVRPFFRKTSVQLSTKVMVIQSLVVSRLTYNMHVLTKLSPRVLREWEAGMRSMIAPLARPFLLGLPPFQFTTTTLCGLIGVLAPTDQLHVNRLRYVKRLVQHCPAVLWNLLHALSDAPYSWISSLRESLDWLRKHYGPDRLPGPDAPFEDWWSLIALAERWNGFVKRAARACLSFNKAVAQQLVWEKSVEAQLLRDGALAPLDQMPALAEPWACEKCELVFASKKALAVHAAKVHQYRALVQHFAIDGTCPCCCRIFHQRSRLMAHLRTMHSCMEQLRACFPPLPEVLIRELNDLDAAHTREMKAHGWFGTRALQPALRGFGPSLPAPGSPEAALMLSKWTLRRPPDQEPMFEALAGHCDAPAGGTNNPEVTEAESCDSIRFVVQATGNIGGKDGRYEMGGLARLHAALHIRTLCFIHFFSGYRREQDLQTCIEGHWVQGITQLFCVSVDYCLQNANGDLTSEVNQKWWTDRICSGAICGVGGGPPCETYSAARLLPDGPPPLRSHDHISGLPWNSPKGWKQTELGSILMRFILQMLMLVARIGGCAFLEQPAFPTWAIKHRPSSIWSTKVVRLLRRLACTEILTLDQCIYGCPARKPTTLMLVRMPGMVARTRALGRGGRCPHACGWHQALAGRNEQGAFHTSVAKIYPPQLNAALAQSVADFVLDLTSTGQRVEPLPEDFWLLQSFDYVDRTQVQPDHYG